MKKEIIFRNSVLEYIHKIINKIISYFKKQIITARCHNKLHYYCKIFGKTRLIYIKAIK
jgi:translation initiation factor IF-1